MSATRDLRESLSRYMLIIPVARATGTVLGAIVDTWTNGLGIHDNMLLLVNQGAIGTSVNLILEHSHTRAVGSFVDHSALTQITAANTFYDSHKRRFRRYIRIRCVTVAGQATSITSVTFVANRTRREPVALIGTAI